MKMEKKKYEKFSLSLALFDALPVALFGASMILVALRFGSIVFVCGSAVCTLSGLGKVTWKIILAARKKNVELLNRQMRFLMPVGFLLIIVGLILGMNAEKFALLKTAVLSFPSAVFFALTLLGMVLMAVFAKKLDQTKARSNWIEQTTNAIAQGCLLLGVIFAV